MTKTFAIGDIHGCYEQLQSMLRAIQWRHPEGGTIVLLGDYVDRGPRSKDVLDFLSTDLNYMQWKVICLKGNHEHMMVLAHEREDLYAPMWLRNGGQTTILSYGMKVPKNHLDWCNALPLYYEDEHRIFVHAGIQDYLPMAAQEDEVLMWHRYHDDVPNHVFGEKHLVHGHTPSASNPRTISNRTNIDSGCVFGNHLTCAVFDNDIPGPPIDFIQVI